MSCGIDQIQNTEIHELKSIVQNIITEHQIISVGKSVFNALEHFEGNIKLCPSCEAFYGHVNKAVDKLLSDVSTQLVGLGHFTLSLLDSLSQSNLQGQECKESIKALQIKNSELIHCLSQIQHQNEQLRSKVQMMSEMLSKTDNQINEIQMINQQLKNSKILLENKFYAIQSSIVQQKKSEIQLLQKQLSNLRSKHLAVTNQKENIQKQVLYLNQELRTQSFLPSQLSLKIQSRSQSEKRSPLIKLEENELFVKETIQEFNMSPGLIQTKSSLEQDIGSEKAFNFCLYSPAMSNVSQADRLQIQSRIRSQNMNTSDDKENINNINTFMLDDAAEKSQKGQSKNIKTEQFWISKCDKEVQVNFPEEIPNGRSILHEIKEKAKIAKIDSERVRGKIQTDSVKGEFLLSKLSSYLHKVCITNRIKHKSRKYQ